MELPNLDTSCWQVVNYIRAKGNATRNDVMSYTGLSWATVSRMINDMKNKNLIISQGVKLGVKDKLTSESELLKVNPQIGYFLGIVVGKTFIKLRLIDFDFKIKNLPYNGAQDDIELNLSGWRIRTGDCLDSMLINIQKLINEFLKRQEAEKLLGLGFAWPGLVDNVNNIAKKSSKINFYKELKIMDILSREQILRLKGKVLSIENDANCAVVAEKEVGGIDYTARPQKNMVCVILGSGIGAGLILDGKLYRGAGNYSGELGEFVIGERTDNGRGYLEQKIINILGKALNNNDLILDKDHVNHRELGRLVGDGLSYVIKILNPELIVLTGRISEAYDLFRNSLREVIQETCSGFTLEKLEIEKSVLGQDSPAIGAAICAYNRFIMLCDNNFLIF